MRNQSVLESEIRAMKRLLSVGCCLVAATSLAGTASPRTALSSVACRLADGKTTIRVAGEREPVFTVFRLSDPDRLVIDVADADVAAIKGNHACDGAVTGVVASQFTDAKATVGRLLVGLNNPARYDVRAEKTELVVEVDAAAGTDAPVVAKAAPQPQPTPSADGILSSRVDERAVAHAADRLVSASLAGGEVVKLKTNGEVGKFEVIELDGPARVAIDLYGVKRGPKALKLSSELVREVRVGASADKLRVVTELANGRRPFEVTRRADGVWLSFKAGAAPVQVAEQAHGQGQVAEIDGQVILDETAAPPPPAQRAVVKDVEFIEADGAGKVKIKLTGKPAFKVERPDGKSAVLTLEGATIAKGRERSMDTTELGTPVQMVSVFNVGGSEPRVRVAVAGAQALSERVTEVGDGLVWTFSTSEGAATDRQVSGFVTEASQSAESSAPQQDRRRYVGKRVSFEFKDIDIHNLLRIIAEISKKNIVVGDDVSGKITIRLRNVPWDQALDLVLRSKQLGMEDLGNIIRVAPLQKLEDEAKSRAERKRQMEEAQELQLSLIPVNYALAGEMTGRVKDVLTKRGVVSVDTRTNTLIVRDLPQNMGKVRTMVQSLDTPTPQVLIESRIVEANTTIQREIGIQWGGQGNMSPASGNPTGLVFPNTVSVAGGIAGGANQGTASLPNYAVSLPVGAGDGRGGALGFIFGSAGGALQLNLRLSALEAQGSVKTISAPKVTTLDNEQARISQGVSIPFSQVSAAGANTQFIEARLSLDVVPHITQDGSVLMKIQAQNNQPDPANTGANGQPSIQRKEAQTTVLVKDGDTTVIGGIYVRTGSQTQSGVPILSKIPILGFFFRNNRELETKQELLIFITPRILNRQQLATNQ